jgi:putative ABC transport system permease protein
LQRVNPVVAVQQLMTGEINLSAAHYREPVQAAAFYEEVIQRLESLPGVQAATFSTLQPLSGVSQNDPFCIEGRKLNPTELTSSGWQVVGPNYLRTLGIPLIKGRDITHSDSNPNSPVVAVINEKMAARYWPNENPIGQRLTLGLPRDGNPWITIVGVAKDLPQRLDLPTEPGWLLSRAADVQPNRFIFVRGTGNIAGLGKGIRDTVQSIDHNQPVISIRPMSEVVSQTIAPRKFNTFLLAVFATVALGLAALGTYSVISYSVALRTQEIAIRLALGAGKANILQLVVKRGMKLAILGTLIGLLVAFVLSRLMTNMLFEISATDPFTYVFVSLFSLTVAFLACYVPARKATKVDPLEALRF